MAASLAFVIPVLNEAEHVATVLRSLRQRFAAAQLIVVDGGSADNTVIEAMPLCDQLLLGTPGRAAQMNLGGRAATADYLCFLHADSLPGITAPDFDHCLAQRPSWGFCTVRLSSPRRVFRIIEWFINQRSRLTAVATGDQMLFLRRDVFEQTGGFDPLPLMEDVAYSKRLRQLAPPCVVAEPVQTSSRRWEQHGVVRTVVQMWSLRLAYFCGVSPTRLARIYHGS